MYQYQVFKSMADCTKSTIFIYRQQHNNADVVKHLISSKVMASQCTGIDRSNIGLNDNTQTHMYRERERERFFK